MFLYCLASPFLFLLTFKNKYRSSIPRRFFLRQFKLSFFPHYWFHSCSLGESKSYEPILKTLLTQEPDAQILCTCTTATGFAYLQELSKNLSPNLEIHYLPFEIFLPFWLSKLKNLKTLIVTEAEFWKMLFWVAKRSGARTILVNARISDRSLKSYRRFKIFYRTLFALIDYTLAQLQSDQERLEELGATRVQVFGNLKIFSIPCITRHYHKTMPLIVAASTHANEEKFIFNSFMHSRIQAKLIIAPRHPERFDEVQKLLKTLCKESSLSFSTLNEVWGDIVLVNTLGELNNLYAIADCVILGGSFEPIGGHNPLEPAYFHTPILSGPYIYNQKALFALVQNALIIPKEELSQSLASLDTLPKTKIKESDSKMQFLISLIQRK